MRLRRQLPLLGLGGQHPGPRLSPVRIVGVGVGAQLTEVGLRISGRPHLRRLQPADHRRLRIPGLGSLPGSRIGPPGRPIHPAGRLDFGNLGDLIPAGPVAALWVLPGALRPVAVAATPGSRAAQAGRPDPGPGPTPRPRNDSDGSPATHPRLHLRTRTRPRITLSPGLSSARPSFPASGPTSRLSSASPIPATRTTRLSFPLDRPPPDPPPLDRPLPDPALHTARQFPVSLFPARDSPTLFPARDSPTLFPARDPPTLFPARDPLTLFPARDPLTLSPALDLDLDLASGASATAQRPGARSPPPGLGHTLFRIGRFFPGSPVIRFFRISVSPLGASA